MSLYKILKLADKFENKISEEKYDVISDKLFQLVKSLYPYVADNNLQDKGDSFELVIEIMESPHYTSDKPKLSDEGFQKLLDSTIKIIKDNFDVIDVLVKDTSESFVGEGKILAIIAKISK